MELATTKILLAFQKFISRRGICEAIYSDNAKIFKMAENDLGQTWNLIKYLEVQNYFNDK